MSFVAVKGKYGPVNSR
ncbi:hypothetical protein Nmel_018609 [Mimus melanotis]